MAIENRVQLFNIQSPEVKLKFNSAVAVSASFSSHPYLSYSTYACARLSVRAYV